MKIGDIINYENYSEAVKWCNENNAKLEEVEPIYENVEVPESGFFDEAGDYIILEEKHTEKKEIRRFKIVEIPKPSLDELKDMKRQEINGDRDNARKTEGAEYDGDIFDIDEVSQSNILAQIKVAEIIGDPKATYNYRSKTNTDHLLTLAQLQELGLAIAVKVNAIYVKSWDLKAQVDKATTAEEVEVIKWTSA